MSEIVRTVTSASAPATVSASESVTSTVPDTHKHVRPTLEELRTHFPPSAVLAHLADKFHQEQGWYWSRFAAFAGLHAGLFVLGTSNAVGQESWWFQGFGVILALLWAWVQWLSLGYVRRDKRRYYRYMDEILGFSRLLEDETLHTERTAEVLRQDRSASTVAGVVVAFAVLVLWLIPFALESYLAVLAR